MKQVLIILAFICIHSSFSAIMKAGFHTSDNILSKFADKSKKELFKVFHLLHKKSYSLASEEAKIRFRIFKSNLKQIEEFNSKSSSYKKGLGPFSDLEENEFTDNFLIDSKIASKKFIKGIEDQIYPEFKNPTQNQFLAANDDDDDDLTKRNLSFEIPTFKNTLLEAKDQLKCKSSWAFSTIALLEHNIFKCKSKKVVLSEQYLLDCDKTNGGCYSGNPVDAIDFIQFSKGVPQIDEYEYQGISKSCPQQFTNNLYNFRGRISSCMQDQNKPCKVQDFNRLLEVGPIVVMVDARNWKDYKSGIYEEVQSNERNHFAVVVGQGVDEITKKSYYLVRNSFGESWGQKGYMKYAFEEGKNNSVNEYGIAFVSNCN